MAQIISLFTYLFISSFSVHATVVLNEVAIQPNQVVELYNSASSSADISGWYIDDAGGSTYFTVPQQTLLAPQSCTVLTADFNFNKSSTDTIRLFDNSAPPPSSSAKLLENYSYSKAPDSGYSFVKIVDGGAEWQTSTSSLGLFNEALTSCVPTPTPTPIPTETPSPTPTTAPSPTPDTLSPTPFIDYQNIFISEVFPYPEVNEHEWLELYNNNDYKVCLEKWYIDDGENSGSTPKQISLCLEPYAYSATDIASSLYNNNGDSVRLLNAEKTEKDSLEYGELVQGKSMGRISFENDNFCEQTPSKNAPNTDCITQASPASTATPLTTKILPTPTKKQVFSKSKEMMVATKHAQSVTNNIDGEILGELIEVSESTSPIIYTSFVSFSYSLLTIVSVFIKMKNASIF